MYGHQFEDAVEKNPIILEQAGNDDLDVSASIPSVDHNDIDLKN